MDLVMYQVTQIRQRRFSVRNDRLNEEAGDRWAGDEYHAYYVATWLYRLGIETKRYETKRIYRACSRVSAVVLLSSSTYIDRAAAKSRIMVTMYVV